MIKIEHKMSARRDFRYYTLLLLGLVFVWAGVTVDPEKNCDESGKGCAPWLVTIALGVGVLATISGIAVMIGNHKWGSQLDVAQRKLIWWDTKLSTETHTISMDDVSRIKVQLSSEGSDNIFLYDKDGVLIPIPAEEIYPSNYEKWARDVGTHFPHISVELE